MSSKILNKKLQANNTEQTHTIGSKFRGISILNDGPDDVQVDFDHVVDGDSRKIPSGVALNISQDFLVLHYKDINNTGATLYVTFIQNP